MIELMVGLVVLGLAMVAMLPSIVDWTEGLAVRNAAESLKAGVEKARQEALKRNSDMTFWLVQDGGKTLTDSCRRSSTSASWVVSKLDPSGKCARSPSNSTDPRIVDKWSAFEGARNVTVVGLDSAGSAANAVAFNSLGQPIAGQLATLSVSKGGARALRLEIDLGGSVRVCDPSVSMAGTDTRACRMVIAS